MPRLHRSLGAALALSLASSVAAAQAPALSPLQLRARAIHKEMVETNTVDSVGSVTVLAEKLQKRFLAAGFPAADVQLLVPPGKPTKGNLVVRYRGRGGKAAGKPILLLAHLDVVAARRSDWATDPFVLREEGGFFIGRGVWDDKAMASIFVANLLAWKEAKWVPERDLVLALTADEEGGDANGVDWLVKTHRELIDAEYAINEGGDGQLRDGKPVFHTVQAAEKVPVDYTLTVTNPGGHSSRPRPDNAITQLAQALVKVGAHQFPVQLNDVTRAQLLETAKVERPAVAAAMRALVANEQDAAAAATIAAASAENNSTLRTTCVATRLSGGHAYNALPQLAQANINCRVLPSSNEREVMAELARVIGDTGVRIALAYPPRRPFGLAPAPLRPEVLQAVTDLTHRIWGEIPVIQKMQVGATDGAYLNAIGIPTYGINGLFNENNDDYRHGLNERIRVKSYDDGLEFLRLLVERLAGAPRV